jgi:hypothetical protein
MTPKSLVWFAFTAFSLQMGYAQAPDFFKSYEVTPGGKIFINTFSGNFLVRGYKGSQVEIRASKKGADSKSIEITEDKNVPGLIALWVRFPQLDPGRFEGGKYPPGKLPPGKFPQSGFPPPGGFPPVGFNPGPPDTGNNSVDFEILVPKSNRSDNYLDLRCTRGNIEISNLSWHIRASSVVGNVVVKDARGSIDASSAHGVVRVDIASHKDPGIMKFSTDNGEVIVRAPGNLDAQVYMSTNTGRIKTDFKLEEKGMLIGQKPTAAGTLGSGRQKLAIWSNRGSISLLKK